MYHTPADLAALLDEALKARDRATPGREVLQELFETIYAASLKTEEGQDIAFHIAFANPSDPDPDPPPRIRSNRWWSVRLGQRVPFTVEQLTKLAKASDPRTSSLATFFDEKNSVFVWGLIDQGNRYFEYLNYDSETAHASRPGIFQASIEGPAHVTAWMDFDKVAELRGTELAGAALEAMDRGPLRERLDIGLGVIAAAIFERRREDLESAPDATGTAADEPSGMAEDEELAVTDTDGGEDELDDSAEEADEDGTPFEWYVASNCLEALKRILIRAQNYGHGGAILITSNVGEDLNVKYVLDYPRLRDALIDGNCSGRCAGPVAVGGEQA